MRHACRPSSASVSSGTGRGGSRRRLLHRRRRRPDVLVVSGAIFSTLGGLLGALIFKKQLPPATIDILAIEPESAVAFRTSAARSAHPAPQVRIYRQSCRSESLGRGLCVASPAAAGPRLVARAGVVACVVASGRRRRADADAAADPARRARAGGRSRQPHVHADLRAAGADQGSAAAARARHDPEPCSRPGHRRLVHRRAEERHRPAGARARSCRRSASTTPSTATFVRVFAREPETRLFDINYIATERTAASTVGGAGDRGEQLASRVDARRGPTSSRI